MSKTSAKVKNRWNAKHYRTYRPNLKIEDDADLIKFVEESKGKYSASDFFRAGVIAIMEKDRK